MVISKPPERLQVWLRRYKQIHRAAFVGDQKWIEWFTRLIGPFTRAEEKHFPEGQIEAALTGHVQKPWMGILAIT